MQSGFSFTHVFRRYWVLGSYFKGSTTRYTCSISCIFEWTNYPYIGTFLSYEEDLRRWNTDRTLRLYTEILKCEMDRACDRKQYRHVAAHLDKLKVYPNGREEAKKLAAYWYMYHKNRPAMKDELKKTGYPQE